MWVFGTGGVKVLDRLCDMCCVVVCYLTRARAAKLPVALSAQRQPFLMYERSTASPAALPADIKVHELGQWRSASGSICSRARNVPPEFSGPLACLFIVIINTIMFGLK